MRNCKNTLLLECESNLYLISIIQATAGTPPSNSRQKLAWIPSPDDQRAALKFNKISHVKITGPEILLPFRGCSSKWEAEATG
jgi:hypothetical protein